MMFKKSLEYSKGHQFSIIYETYWPASSLSLLKTFIYIIIPVQLKRVFPLATHLGSFNQLTILKQVFRVLSATKVSNDERMVKDKASCHYKQYMKSKSTKF